MYNTTRLFHNPADKMSMYGHSKYGYGDWCV